MLKKYFSSFIIITFIFPIIFWGGCSSSGPGEKAVLSLEESVESYWKARIERDLKTSYDFENPETKKKIPFTGYLGGSMLQYLSYKVENIKAGENKAEATVSITYKLLAAEFIKHPITAEFKDHWQKIEGRWYHKYRKGLVSGKKAGGKKEKSKEQGEKRGQK